MRLFLADTDDKARVRMMWSANHPYLLTSFWKHTQSRGVNREWLSWTRKISSAGGLYIMDSGVFSMMYGSDSAKKYTERDLREYLHLYLQQLKEIDWHGLAVELDVHKVIGMDPVSRFRKIMEESTDPERTMYVWHIEEKTDGLKKMADRYPLIALSIPELKKVFRKKHEQVIRQLIEMALKVNPDVRIHLLGTTSYKLLERLRGYWSADSTSWNNSLRYNDTTLWLSGKMLKVDPRDPRFRRECDLVEPALRKTMGDEMPPNDEYCIRGTAAIRQFNLMNHKINRDRFNGEAVPKLWEKI